MVLLGSICEGRRAPAVTIFGWDDVLCPTTHARVERNKRAESAAGSCGRGGGAGLPTARSRDDRKQVGGMISYVTLTLGSR